MARKGQTTVGTPSWVGESSGGSLSVVQGGRELKRSPEIREIENKETQLRQVHMEEW